MTLTGHTATSGALGYMAYSLTGSAALGHAVAFAAHVPADWIVNEFWQWGDQVAYRVAGYTITFNHLLLVLFEIPAIVMLGFIAYIDWRALLFGLMGNMPDVIDAVLERLGRPPVFPCHFGSKPWHLEPFFKMLSLKATAVVDTILAALFLGGVWWLQR